MTAGAVDILIKSLRRGRLQSRFWAVRLALICSLISAEAQMDYRCNVAESVCNVC